MIDPAPRHHTVAGFLALLLAVTFSFGCDQQHEVASGVQCDPHPADVAIRDFADAFTAREPLVFPTSDTSPVLSVRSLSASPSGQLLVTDSRSRNLKVVDVAGRVIRIIGGEGEGPGEFTVLMDAVFLSDDRIAALDAGLVRVTLFDSAGQVLHTLALEDQQDPRVIVAIDESAFLIGGMVSSAGGENRLLAVPNGCGLVGCQRC